MLSPLLAATLCISSKNNEGAAKFSRLEEMSGAGGGSSLELEVPHIRNGFIERFLHFERVAVSCSSLPRKDQRRL